MLTSLGYESQKVAQEMAGPELQLRFLDCLKLLRRQQQMQATTLIGSVGAFLVKKKDKTILEEINDEIASINALSGDCEAEVKQKQELTEEQQKKCQEEFLKKAVLDREKFIARRKAGKVKSLPFGGK